MRESEIMTQDSADYPDDLLKKVSDAIGKMEVGIGSFRGPLGSLIFRDEVERLARVAVEQFRYEDTRDKYCNPFANYLAHYEIAFNEARRYHGVYESRMAGLNAMFKAILGED